MEILKIILTIISIFVIGSVVGYIIELFWRRFVSQHKWMNPGFLVGPYLPIYGFGAIVLYFINLAINQIPFSQNLLWLKIIVSLILIAIALTLVEFLAGLIFIKGLKIKLWDYSKTKGNIMGIICPIYTLFWFIAGAVYYFLINEPLTNFLGFLAEHEIFYFFVGLIIGMMIVDFCYSMHVYSTISKFARENKIIVSIIQFQEVAKEKNAKKLGKLNEKIKKPFFFVYGNLKESINSFKEKMSDSIKKEK